MFLVQRVSGSVTSKQVSQLACIQSAALSINNSLLPGGSVPVLNLCVGKEDHPLRLARPNECGLVFDSEDTRNRNLRLSRLQEIENGDPIGRVLGRSGGP